MYHVAYVGHFTERSKKLPTQDIVDNTCRHRTYLLLISYLCYKRLKCPTISEFTDGIANWDSIRKQ